MKAKKALLAVPALLLAANVNAACLASRPAAAPAIPNGAAVDAEAMYAAQEATKAYVAGVEKYLECRSDQLGYLEHNYFVSRAQEVAESYNSELQKFRSRDEAIASS
ncbi:hypothetical protein [Haliea sp. E17]|uniref:hypothetical protein n=1 Tax=Haliea sp. E17 TaxID=3401576 RepID=UPI003AAABD24